MFSHLLSPFGHVDTVKVSSSWVGVSVAYVRGAER